METIYYVASLFLHGIVALCAIYIVLRGKKANPKRRTSAKKAMTGLATPVIAKTVYLHEDHDDSVVSKAAMKQSGDDVW